MDRANTGTLAQHRLPFLQGFVVATRMQLSVLNVLLWTQHLFWGDNAQRSIVWEHASTR